MSEGNCIQKLTLPEAQEEFLNIVRKCKNENNLKELLDWIQWNWLKETKTASDPEKLLNTIAADLRSCMPPDAILPSEIIRSPSFGKNSDCDPSHTIHVDAFLYDDELVDNLCDEGKLARSYCLQCGSHNTQPLTYISHSLSKERLLFIFKSMLPPLDNKIILDIGSRLGAVLYGAYLYTKAAKIVGVEVNSDFCKLQGEIIKKYSFQDRIEVVEADVAHRPDVVHAADVIILNNCFEFFMEPDQQIFMWKFLRQNIKSGTLLVTVPPLEDTFSFLKTGINLSDWVQCLPLYNNDAAGVSLNSEEMEELKHYIVL